MKTSSHPWLKFVLAAVLMVLGASGSRAVDFSPTVEGEAGARNTSDIVTVTANQVPADQRLRMNHPPQGSSEPLVHVDSDGEDGIFDGNYMAAAKRVEITAPRGAGQGLSTLAFIFPGNGAPAPGTYSLRPNLAGSMGISISQTRAGLASSVIDGTVKVLSVSLTPGGDLDSFHATFTIFTRETVLPIVGEIRFQLPGEAELPPLFTAGLDREIDSPEAPMLRGGILVRGSSTPTLQWSKVSGPGEVTFTNPDEVVTPVQFSAKGTYVLRLQVTDGANVYSDDVQIADTGLETVIATKAIKHARLHAAPEQMISATITGSKLTFNTHIEGGFSDGMYEFTVPSGQAPGKGTWETGPNGTGSMNLPFGSNPPGRFEIVELVRDNQGNVLSAWVKFGAAVPDSFPFNLEGYFGEVRYRKPITAPPVNLPPRVDVGPDLVTDVDQLSLVAGIDDDLLPYNNVLQYSWEVISGPAAVNFSLPDNRGTNATFSKDGNYTLRLSVTDGDLTTSDDLNVVVKSVKRRYEGRAMFQGAPIGTAIFNMTAKNAFTATVRVGTSVVRFKGNLAGGSWSKSFKTAAGTKVELNFSRADADNALVGTMKLNDNLVEIFTKQTYGSFKGATGTANANAGRHTIGLIPPDGVNVSGAGFGDIVVKPSGAYRMKGVLADGVPFSLGGNLTIDEVFDIYVYLRAGNELLFGPARFNAEEGLIGQIGWIRRPGKNQPVFPEGIQTNVALRGSRYQLPVTGESIFGLTANVPAEINLFDSSFAQPLGANLNFVPGGNEAANAPTGFELKVDPKTGFFQGSFIDPLSKKRKFRGAILQELGIGVGHFGIEKRSGGVFIEATLPQPSEQ